MGGQKREYWIRWNGMFHFFVSISGSGRVSVHSHVPDDTQWLYDEHPLIQWGHHPKQIFIGKSRRNYLTRQSRAYGERYDGNTILLHLAGQQYVFIGKQVVSFRTNSPIVRYESPMASNDIPMPYAINAAGAYYLFPELLRLVPPFTRAVSRVLTAEHPHNVLFAKLHKRVRPLQTRLLVKHPEGRARRTRGPIGSCAP